MWKRPAVSPLGGTVGLAGYSRGVIGLFNTVQCGSGKVLDPQSTKTVTLCQNVKVPVCLRICHVLGAM